MMSKLSDDAIKFVFAYEEAQLSNAYYDMINTIESALFEYLMIRFKENQLRAALWSGFNRNNFRRKLFEHFGNRYVNRLED